jgi:putative ubiquitin-RnfH superfamily antitoxin RatB of RatAB toxin-antitoxin module
MRIEVVQAGPERAKVVEVRLAAGATVADALRAAGVEAPEGIGIFGKRVSVDTRLADGDRVEIYRRLLMDPKEARRARARRR